MILLFSAIILLTCSDSFAADNITDSVDFNVEPNPPGTLSQSSIIDASNYVKSYTDKNKKLPDYVTISGYNFSMPEFIYLLSKTVDNQYKKSNSQITVKYNIKNPSEPFGTNINTKIQSKNYHDYAIRTAKFIDNNNQAPNFIRAPKGSKIQYQTAIYMFSSVLSNINSKNELPSSVSTNIKNSNSINKYLPTYEEILPTYEEIIPEFILGIKPLKVIYPQGKNTPSKVVMNSTHIYVYDVRCSCGRLGHYKPIKEVVFKNYCPDTKKWGVLKYNIKRVAEGEFTSPVGRDYCAATGFEKWKPMRAKLLKW